MCVLFAAGAGDGSKYRPAKNWLTASKLPMLLTSAVKATGSPAKTGWEGLLTRPLEILDLPGDHYSMLRPPAVQDLARILRDRLGRGKISPSS